MSGSSEVAGTMNHRIRREGTQALCAAAARIRARALVLQSIVWVARPPDDAPFDETSPAVPDPVTQSAFDAENIAREAGERDGFRTAVLRCGFFYGPDAAHTRRMGEEIVARRMPLIGSGDAIWANLHIDDAAATFVRAAESGMAGLWHVVDDQPLPVREMLMEWAELLGAPNPRTVPVRLAGWIVGARAVDFFTRSTRTSNARFRNDFGWAPRFPSWRDGVRQVIAAWKEEGFPGAAKFGTAA